MVTSKTAQIRGRGIGTIESALVLPEFSQKVRDLTFSQKRASFLPGDPQNVHLLLPKVTESVHNPSVLTL